MNTEHKNWIIKYYDETRFDYRVLWFRDKNRSVHFGYYDEGITDHGEALLNLNKVMARKAAIGDGDIILDAGCGQGGSSCWMAQNYDVTVKGITLVPHQVQKAKKYAASLGVSEAVEFYEMDYTQTTFEDESFTVIWACESLCHALNKEDFYKEAYRLLKPGGRLICAEYFRMDRPLPQEGEDLLMAWLNGWSIQDIDTEQEHKEHARKSGFSDIEFQDVTQFTKPSLEYLHTMSTKLWKLGKFFRKIGLRNDVNHNNQYSSIKQYQALEKEYWKYGLISMKK